MPNFNTRQGIGFPLTGRVTVGTALQINTIDGSLHTDPDNFFDGELSATEVLGSIHTDPDTFFNGSFTGTQEISGSKLGDSIEVIDSITGSSASMLTHEINLPNNSNVNGQLLVIAVSADDNPSFTFPAGWTELIDTSGTLIALGATYRVVDGTEGFSGENDTINITLSQSEPITYISYLIKNSNSSIEASTTSNTNTSPDPPSISPSGGYDNYLFISLSAHDNGVTSVTGYPSGYVNNQTISDGSTSGCGIGGAHLIRTIDDEDPGSFTISATRQWVAASISVRSTEIPTTDTIFHGSMQGIIEGSFLVNTNVFNQSTIYHGTGVSISQREITGYSEENPKPYTLEGGRSWIAITIAVKGG